MISWAPTMVRDSKRYSTSRDFNSILPQFTKSHFKSEEIWRCPFDTIGVILFRDQRCSKIDAYFPHQTVMKQVKLAAMFLQQIQP